MQPFLLKVYKPVYKKLNQHSPTRHEQALSISIPLSTRCSVFVLPEKQEKLRSPHYRFHSVFPRPFRTSEYADTYKEITVICAYDKYTRLRCVRFE